MIVFGIDPGYGRLGYGVLSVIRDRISIITCGCLETSVALVPAERLAQVRKTLEALIEKYHPDVAGVERLFFQKNVKTALRVAEARGVVLVTFASAGIKIIECSPQEVKLAVTGYGNAGKQQVQEMVRVILSLKEIPKSDDAADALALALATSRLVGQPNL